MENKKDTKRQPQSNRLKGDLSLSLNFNANDRYYYLILKKAEKLGTASYMLTDHIDDSEPIKNGIRTCALTLLKDTYSPEYHSDKKDKKGKTISTLACIEHILSLFDIALVSRMISTGNHAVIKKEYLMLREAVLELAESIENKIIFPEDLFAVTNARKSAAPVPNFGMGNPDRSSMNLYNRHVRYNDVLYKNKQQEVEKKHSASITNRGERGELILNLISSGKEVSIKDIHSHFNDCSEKTIQRELSKMLLKGLVIRKGDKRWSRYSLASR